MTRRFASASWALVLVPAGVVLFAVVAERASSRASLEHVAATSAKFSEPVLATASAALPLPARRARFYSGSQWHDAAVYTRDQLAPGHKVKQHH